MVALVLLLLLLAALPTLWVARHGSSTQRRALALLLFAALGALPWLVPAADPILRLFVSLGVILAWARSLEALLGFAPARALEDWLSFLTYFFSIGELVFSTDPVEHRRARAVGLRRLLRGLGKGALLLFCFALSTAEPQLHAYWPTHYLWCLFAAYFAASGLVDLLTGVGMLITGHQAGEIFDCPHLASSPRDFWSRRWNRMFRNAAHRLVFTPLGGAKRPLLAVGGVFLVSALVHEYIVLAALGYSRGHMSAFFALHGVTTLGTGVRRSPWPVPRGLDVACHSAWLLVTAPLFFIPMEQILPARDWALW